MSFRNCEEGVLGKMEGMDGWITMEHRKAFGLVGYDYYLHGGDYFIVTYTCQNSTYFIY